MKKNHLSTETLVFEIISAIAALFYMGLQVYYGIVYGAGAVRIVMNGAYCAGYLPGAR